LSSGVLIGAAVLGGFGAVLRFALDSAVSARSSTSFPLGTLAVNLLGALVLGLLLGAGVTGEALKLLALGLLGGFTTFSTWMFETHRLAEDGLIRMAAANVAVSVLFGVLAIWAGKLIGGIL
jgi:CrcB protein